MPNQIDRFIQLRLLPELKHLAETTVTELGVKPTSFTWTDGSSSREWRLDYPFLVSEGVTRGVKIQANLNFMKTTLTLKIYGYMTRGSQTVFGPELTDRMEIASPTGEKISQNVREGLRAILTWAINN